MTKNKEEALSIPSFLHSHLKQMLPVFIKNAFHVAFYYNEGETYKIAQKSEDKDGENHQYDSIIPVDVESTGMLLLNRKYSDGTQQFLELKHQLSLSDVSLMTNYMSNFSLYSRYEELLGVTGTLGNHTDTDFLKDKLSLTCKKIPSHKESSVRHGSFLLCETEEEWMENVVENAIFVAKAGQAVLLICKDMNTSEEVYRQIVEVHNYNRNKVQTYWRDDTQKLDKKV